MSVVDLSKKEIHGHIEAYILEGDSQEMEDWLHQKLDSKVANAIYNYLSIQSDKVLIVESMEVREEHRGAGYGKQFLEDAMREADTDNILLVADVDREQEPGFCLNHFYSSRGFSTVYGSYVGPIMAYPANIALMLRAQIKRENSLNSEHNGASFTY